MKRIEVIDLRSEVAKEMIRVMDEKIYYDTDSVKQILNARYGKEVGMKDYIVVHQNNKGDNRNAIIFKKNIDAVLETPTGTNLIVNGYSVYCDDKYKDIVTKVLK